VRKIFGSKRFWSLMAGGCIFLGGAVLADESEERFVGAGVTTVGLDQRNRSPVVILQEHGTGRLLPIWIGFPEAQSIAIALEGLAPPRPMTHDLLRNVIEESDLQVEGIRVEALRGGTYFGTIQGHHRQKDGERGADFSIDSRPSDAIALALRLEVPILVSETLLIEIPDFDFTPGSPDGRIRLAGLELADASPEQLRAAGLEAGTSGLVVTRILRDAPEEIEPGDVLTHAAEKPVGNIAEFVRQLQILGPQGKIEVRIHREGRSWKQTLPLLPGEVTPDDQADRLQV
jgi:bifunctional DNase/RNase